MRTYYLVGSLGFGCELWTDQGGLVSPIRLTSAFLLAASIAATASLNDWIMSKNPFSFRTSSRHALLSHKNWPKETHFEKIVSNQKFSPKITKLEFSVISSNILIFANTCAANTHRDLWHLRYWLKYWQLRTWINDNLCYLTINCDTGQHSQFLRCFIWYFLLL